MSDRSKFISLVKALIPVTIALFNSLGCAKETNQKTNITTQTTIDNAAGYEPGLTSGLVAWYTFNGNTLDSSGNNNNVIFNNATPVADRFGNPKGAYQFNGINNYMRVANNATINQRHKISLFAIVKVNGFYQGQCHANRILNKGLNDNSKGVYFLQFDDAYFYHYNHCNKEVNEHRENFSANFGNGQGASIGGVDTMDNIRLNPWYNIVFTYDSDTAKLYVNGALTYTSIGTYAFTPNTEDLFFGMGNIKNTQFPYWFNGIIDEIRIYNRALTANEVRRLNHYTRFPPQ